MGGITCNAEGFAGETGVVDVLEGGERDTNNLLSCSHYPLKGLVAGRVGGAIPHSDAASQDALDGASVEGAHDGGRGSGSSEVAEEVETRCAFLASAAVLLVQERYALVMRIDYEETDKCISNLQTWIAFKIFFFAFLHKI